MVAEKDKYLARGDAISPTSQGTDDLITPSTTILTAAKFAKFTANAAERSRFAANASADGGFDVAREGRLYEASPFDDAAAPAGTWTLEPTSGSFSTQYDQTFKQIAGHVPKRAADGNVDAAPAADFLLDEDTAVHFSELPNDGSGIAKVFNFGIAVSPVPSRAEQNPRSGQFEFTQETAVMGVVATPASVSYDLGLDELTLVLSGEKLLGNGDSLAGRAALAWKVTPLGITGVALVFGTLTNTGSNELVIAGAFGQAPASVSTTPGDYRVCVLGAAVWSSGGLENLVDGVAFVGRGNRSGAPVVAFSQTGQNVYPTMHMLLNHVLKMAAANSAVPTAPPHHFLPKIDVVPSDDEALTEPQLTVWQDAARSVIAFQVLRDGTVTLGPQTNLGGYASLEVFIAATSPGDVAVIDTFDPSINPYLQENTAELEAVGATVSGVTTDGQYLVVATNDGGTRAVQLRERFAPFAVVAAHPGFVLNPPTGTVNGIVNAVSNGAFVAVGYGTTTGLGVLEIFNRDTGASLGVNSHGAFLLADCAIDGLRAYLTGNRNTADDVSVRAVLLSSPAVFDWSTILDVGAGIQNSIYSDGFLVYVGGALAGADNLQALVATTGFAQWQDGGGGLVPGAQSIITDGLDLYVARTASVLEHRSAADGTLLDTVTLSNNVANFVMDRRYLWVVDLNLNCLLRHQREQSLSVHGVPIYALTHGAAVGGIAYDGDKLFLGGTISGSINFRQYRPPQRTRTWRRVASDDLFLPMRQLAIPSDH